MTSLRAAPRSTLYPPAPMPTPDSAVSPIATEAPAATSAATPTAFGHGLDRWRRVVATLGAILLLALNATGCDHPPPSTDHFDVVIGARGGTSGKFDRPRGCVFDEASQLLYVVDWDGRIQSFTRDGAFRSSWIMPAVKKGKPEELALTPRGTLLVADTHYSRIVEFNLDGTVRGMFGSYGTGPGQFIYTVGVAVDKAGNIYVTEYGDNDRVQKFTADGELITQWGGFGTEPGKFQRPSGICISDDDRVFIADGVNHRVQVFDLDGKLLYVIGKQGHELGEFGYPYDVGVRGDTLYVLEYGNQRVQKMTLDGKPLAVFGTPGRGDGQFSSPWRMEVTKEDIFVSDTQNFRVARITF